MSTEIFHGPPGSYKSSSVLWFKLLPALREGRLVVSNLQGLKTVEEIQSDLNEVFPSTARIIRISIGADSGLELMRNFYQWLPIGAFIFIDEVQDVYPNDRSFKASDYDYKTEGFFNDLLPSELVTEYHKQQKSIKDTIDIESYQDDTGASLFNDSGYLRYPRTLRECFMRHRHFNWDIVLATPDIKEVLPFVRSVTEIAFAHSSKDAIPIAYYKRRPRVLQHMPKENGLKVQKNDIVINRKIPLDVFKLYKSTATGKTTKSGTGASPIGISIVLGMLFVLAYIIYMVYWYGIREADENPLSVPKETSIQKADSSQDLPQNNVIVQNDSVKDLQVDKDISSFSARHASVSTIVAPSNFVNLPFNASRMYLNAVNTVYLNQHEITRDYVFTVYINDDVLSVGSETLFAIGYKIFFISECLVELRSDISSHFLYCEPTKSINNDARTSSQPESLDLDVKPF